MIDIEQDFPSAFKSARNAAGLTQRGVFDVLGIPRRSVQNWEAGVNLPPEWVQRLILSELASLAAND
jgi:DNA-binding transcriptional regulator YiaG